MINPLCECPLAGFCVRHKVTKSPREHDLCKGMNCTPKQTAKYWAAWEAGTMPGQAGPADNPKSFKEGLALPPRSGARRALIPSLRPQGGVGSELKLLLTWFGQYQSAGCSCAKYSAIMDARGIAWCEANIAVIFDWLADEASKRKIAGWSLNKVPGYGWTAERLVRQAIANAKSKSVSVLSSKNAELTPVRAAINSKRNLAWHIWPCNGSSNWRTAIKQLKQRIDLFNGVRAIGVATGPDTVSLEEVQAEFADVRIDHWVHKNNDPRRREGVTFAALLKLMPNDESVTFWGHGKSVRHHEGSICVDWG